MDRLRARLAAGRRRSAVTAAAGVLLPKGEEMGMRGLIRRAAVVTGAAVIITLGTAAAAAAAPPPPGQGLAFSPSPYDYGQVTVGHTTTETFTLAHTSPGPLPPATITLTGSAAFTITADTCTGPPSSPPGPQSKCTVTVQFAPISTGGVTATLTATSNGPGPAATDSLTGTGVSTAQELCESYGGTFGNTNLTFGGWPTILWTCNGWAVEPGVDQYHALGNACIAGGGTGYGASVGDTRGNFTCGHS